MTDSAVESGNRSLVSRLWDGAVDRQAQIVPLVAVLLAFAFGAVLITLQGVDPIKAYSSLFRSALFTTDGFLRTLQKAGPLVLEGLAVAVAFKVGLFNIGAQGQLVAGALGTAVAAHSFAGLPGPVIIPLSLIVGMICGALWASISALLKAYRNVHEVISTIMLNSIAAGIVDYLITGPLKEPDQVIPRTSPIDPAAQLPNVGPIPLSFVIAILLAIALAWLMRRTTLGFQFNTVGKNKFAAMYAGISFRAMVIVSMAISGALAALGGAVDVLGFAGRYEQGLDAGLGFDGITIALLARGNPLATIPAALLVGVLRTGAAGLQFDTGIKPEVVDMLLAITLLLVSIPVLAKAIFRSRAAKAESVTSGWGA